MLEPSTSHCRHPQHALHTPWCLICHNYLCMCLLLLLRTGIKFSSQKYKDMRANLQIQDQDMIKTELKYWGKALTDGWKCLGHETTDFLAHSSHYIQLLLQGQHELNKRLLQLQNFLYTLPVKSVDTPSHLMVFAYFPQPFQVTISWSSSREWQEYAKQ